MIGVRGQLHQDSSHLAQTSTESRALQHFCQTSFFSPLAVCFQVGKLDVKQEPLSEQTLNVCHWRSIESNFTPALKCLASKMMVIHQQTGTIMERPSRRRSWLICGSHEDRGEMRRKTRAVPRCWIIQHRGERRRDNECMWMFQHHGQRTARGEVVSAAP